MSGAIEGHGWREVTIRYCEIAARRMGQEVLEFTQMTLGWWIATERLRP